MTLAGPLRSRLARRLAAFCIAGGVALLLLDFFGLAVPARDPAISRLPRDAYVGNITPALPASEVWSHANRQPGENNRDYAVRLTHLVCDSAAFLYEQDHPELSRRNWRVGPWENYLIWASRHVLFGWRWVRGQAAWDTRQDVLRYVYSDHRRGIERGVSLCDQRSADLVGLLNEHGFKTRYLSYPTHAMVEAEVEPGVWWVLGPTHGLVLPYDQATLHADPNLVREYGKAHGWKPVSIDFMANLFEGPISGGKALDSVKAAHGAGHYYFEYVSYYLIWVIPVLLIAGGYAVLTRLKAFPEASTARVSLAAGADAKRASFNSRPTTGVLDQDGEMEAPAGQPSGQA